MSDCWIVTYSGVQFDLLEPSAEMVVLADIIWSLPRLARYTGHSRGVYSVAQHCVDAISEVPWQYMLEWLLHDAHEAYTGDMNGPLKSHCPSFQRIQGNIDRVIRERFRLPVNCSQAVHTADMRMLATEKRDLMPQATSPWRLLRVVDPYEKKLAPQDEVVVRSRFSSAIKQFLPNEIASEVGSLDPLISAIGK